MSGSYYVKPARRVYGPSCFITVAVEAAAVPHPTNPAVAELVWAGGAACLSRWRAGRWSPVEAETFEHGIDLLTWCEQHVQPGKGTWVVAPIASHALTLAGQFKRWEESGAKWRRRRAVGADAPTDPPPTGQFAADKSDASTLASFNSAAASPPITVETCVLRGNPDIVTYTIGDRRIKWVSGHQYYATSEDALARMLAGYPGGTEPRAGDAPPPPRSAAERAAVWMAAMQRLADWWRDIKGGPWGTTIGQLAQNYYRHRIAPRSILSHQVPDAREVEEQAIFGGRASTFCFAPVGELPNRAADGSTRPPASDWPAQTGGLVHYDVASMYPTILAREVFPEHLLYVRHAPPLERIAEELTYRCVIADVTLRTERAEYPVRTEERVVYPVGEFRTTLAGPELARAIAEGAVTQVHRSTSYRPGRPFQSAAQSLLKLRQDARQMGDPVWELLVKSLSNAFAGKLAQRKFNWHKTDKKAPAVSWGEWATAPDDRTQARRYRAMGGLVWERQDVPHHGRPLASCFAYLTSYGRELLRHLREQLPPDRVVSVDTDGLWIRGETPYYFAKLKRAALDRGYILRRTHGAAGGIWYTPRHYWTDRGWVLAGYHAPERVGKRLRFRDVQRYIPPRELKDGAPTCVVETTRTTTLTARAPEGAVGLDGWARPPRVTAPVPLPPESLDRAGRDSAPEPQSAP